MPAGTATMPIKKQVTNSASGQNHQGKVLEGTTLSAAWAGTASSIHTTASKPMCLVLVTARERSLSMKSRAQEMVW